VAVAEHFDVVIVGAGLSGIGQAYHLQTRCPDRSYVILETRAAIGGTWDLFRYPGIRSDSDMHTLGYGFQPWEGAKAIADGESIRSYIADTAQTHGIDRHIRHGIAVTSAAWSTAEARWTVEGQGPDGPVAFTCNFVSLCSGYYDYAQGHSPDFAGAEEFAGRIVHPQSWPQDLNYAGARVVVIGSGATAVTLVPELAKRAAHVTMLQRSPTYVVSRPANDRVADALRRVLPAKLAYRLTRWKNVSVGMALYRLAKKRPAKVRARIVAMAREHLGHDYDVATHFTPRYDPWDQRVCLVPDADLFAAIRDGRAAVETDTIERFVPEGIRLASGRVLRADLVVTATGLRLKVAGGIAFTVDGEPVSFAGRLQYKGMMFEGVPNLAQTFGYTNASWTLKADLTAAYVCRLLNAMKRRGMRQATPVNDDPALAREPFLDFTSGYVQRAADLLPVQGARKPWRLNQNYALDVVAMRMGSIEEAMRFSNPAPAEAEAA
jgi:monooxygenase